MFSGQIAFESSVEPQSDLQSGSQPDSPSDSQSFYCRINDYHQLRLLRSHDAKELFTLIEANRTHLSQWLSLLPTTQTVDDTRHFIGLTQERARNNQGFAAAICYHNAIVGVIGLHDVRWEDRCSSIGYWLAKPYQGKGLMTTSCQAVIHYGFTQLNLNRLSILCASENVRSQAIPERLGFHYEGTLRDAQWLYTRFVDHKIYAMLKRQWLSLKD